MANRCARRQGRLMHMVFGVESNQTVNTGFAGISRGLPMIFWRSASRGERLARGARPREARAGYAMPRARRFDISTLSFGMAWPSRIAEIQASVVVTAAKLLWNTTLKTRWISSAVTLPAAFS